MSNLAERLQFAIKEQGKSQQWLANHIGVSQQSIGKILKGETLNPKYILEISNALGVSVEWLKTGKGEAPDFTKIEENQTACEKEGNVRLEILDVYASAGEGKFITGDLDGFTRAIEFEQGYFMQMFQQTSANGLSIINIDGDSMKPTLNSGDLLVVNTNIKFFSGDGVYVFSYGDMLYVKRLQLAGDSLLVISDNPLYKTWEITRDNESKLIIHAKAKFSQEKMKELG
ncbi:XRE family transcriptional regulator [Mannheimia glucosida]|uniref:XRE family transcriptional regulator n=1 Tax=Mannheimia glucosida TaxID=85401 RepID=UPI0039185600